MPELHSTVMVSPAKAPAPTLPTNIKPATTAKAPTSPPGGAHQGIWLTDSAVGMGRGKHIQITARSATIGRNETRLPSQGLIKAFLRALFIGGPHACNTPAMMMIG
jgi:hypothetical protein